MSDHLHFFQPTIGIAAKVKPDKGRAKAITRSSHCRALMNTGISNALKGPFVATETTYRTIPAWVGSYGDQYPERKEPIHKRVAKATLGEKSLDYPATLSMALRGLQTHEKKTIKNRYYGETYTYTNYVAKRGPISKQTIKDFFYLADLFCGAFNVLFTPEGEETHWRPSPITRGQPAKLAYLGASSLILLSPALTALYFGQLRLAALLAGAGGAEEIREEVPEKELRQALKDGDRKKCAAFLKAAKPWILRKETGLWAFTTRSPERLDRLLRYLAKGGNAVSLFGRGIARNWCLIGNDPYGADFHNRGFNDYMGGQGDNKVRAALAKKTPRTKMKEAA